MIGQHSSTSCFTLVSLGYERRTIDEVIEILKAYGVKKLIDVRELPMSRKKGFSKGGLSSHLASAGITYLHMREAGNPYHKEKHNLEYCLQLYRSYLERHPEVIERIMSAVTEPRVAFLCYEREHLNCHRSILLHAMRQQGFSARIIEVN
jgi:uncharacterized protein (DUF488 family)